MNFYKRHLGDYAKHAGHLSMLEHGAYTLLLDRYYTTEQPIPSRADAYRVCRARNKDEREAVDAVLAEFFSETECGAFENGRAEEEVAKASHQRAVNQEIGKRGGRPRKTESVIESETESVPCRNPSQTPDSSSNTEGAKAPSRRRGDLPPCPHDDFVERYHLSLPELPRVKLMTDGRRKAMRAFWAWVLTSTKSDGQPRANDADQALTWIGNYFDRAKANDFLMGRTRRGEGHQNWVADFDFLLTDRGRKHVIERTVDA